MGVTDDHIFAVLFQFFPHNYEHNDFIIHRHKLENLYAKLHMCSFFNIV